MKVGNGKTGFRILFDQDNLNMVTGGGKTNTFHLQLNAQSADRFVVISTHELPHSHRVMLSKSTGKREADQLYLTHSARFKPFIQQLPAFGAESVLLIREDVSEPTWRIPRPKMDQKVIERPENYKSKKPFKKAFGHEKEHLPVEMASSLQIKPALPKPESPKPQMELMNKLSTINNMEEAINIINKIKDDKGDSMIMEITQTGRLKVLLEYGS